jgi:hypothetical protein
MDKKVLEYQSKALPLGRFAEVRVINVLQLVPLLTSICVAS